MINRLFRHITLVWVSLCSLSAMAQQTDWFASPETVSSISSQIKQAFEVTGRVFGVDEYEPTPYPLQSATVQMWVMGDSLNMEGGTVYQNGEFYIWKYYAKRLKDTRVKVRISYVGMETYEETFSPEGQKNEYGYTNYTIKLDSLVLKSAPITLEQANIVAELMRMYQKGDTIIFNAQAYEMPTGSMLLDLVRRLPGLEYKEGKLTYMGEDIREIRLNGKSFFERDMSIALNNMPHDKLKSLKIYEVPDDTLRPNSDEHYIMDMETKEPVNLFLSSNMSAGVTIPLEHWELTLSGSAWTDDYDVYVNASSTDIPMGMVDKYHDDNISTYARTTLPKKSGDLSAQYNYSNTYSESSSSNASKTFMPGYTQNSTQESSNGNGSSQHRGSMDYSKTLKAGYYSYLSLGATYSRGNSDYSSLSESSTSNDSLSINHIKRNSTNKSDNSNIDLWGAFYINIDSARRHSVNINSGFYSSESETTSVESSIEEFFQLGDSVRRTNRVNTSPSNSKTFRTNLSYTWSITDNNYLQISGSANYYTLENSTQYNELMSDGMLHSIDSLKRTEHNNRLNTTIGLNYSYNGDAIRTNIDLGISPNKNYSEKTIAQKHDTHSMSSVTYSTTGDFRYRFNQKRDILSLQYSGSSAMPDINNLNNLTDYSDPMHITKGNSNLKQSFSHSFTTGYQFRTFLRTNLTYGWTDRALTTLSIIDRNTGVTTTQQMNINGNWNSSAYIYAQTPIHDISLSGSVRYSHNNRVSYVQNQSDNNYFKSYSKSDQINSEVRVSYSDIHWIAELNSNYTIQNNRNDYSSKVTRGRQFSVNSNFSYNFNFGLRLQTDINLNKRFGYELKSANKTETIWNADVSYRFLKDKSATLSFRATDILRSQTGFRANMGTTSWSETQTSGETSFYILSFSYRFTHM